MDVYSQDEENAKTLAEDSREEKQAQKREATKRLGCTTLVVIVQLNKAIKQTICENTYIRWIIYNSAYFTINNKVSIND